MCGVVVRRLRLAASFATAFAFVALSGGSAQAAAPAGPRLLTFAVHDLGPILSSRSREPLVLLETLSPAGGKPRVIARGRLGPRSLSPNFLTGATWSADGTVVAFAAGEEKRERIFVVSGNGGRPRPVPGTRRGTHPVISPGGGTIAFTRTRMRYGVDKELLPILPKGMKPPKTRLLYASTSTWLIDVDGHHRRRLTPWRKGLFQVPTSFSPDGVSLALTRRATGQSGPQVLLADLASGAQVVVAAKAEEAAISPDGSQIAYVGYADPDPVDAEEGRRYLAPDLYIAEIDGGPVRRLTRSHGVIESAPSWDPSGARIAYVRARASTTFVPELDNLFPVSNKVMQINADGSCRRRLAFRPRVAFYGAAWQPGPGREAGQISC